MVENLLSSTPSTIDLEPPENSNTNDVLVEEIHDPAQKKLGHDRIKGFKVLHVSISRIRPMTVHQQQAFQESELKYLISKQCKTDMKEDTLPEQ